MRAKPLVFLTLGYHPELVGGAWRYCASAAEGLASAGREVHVICPDSEGRKKGLECRRQVRIHWFPKSVGPLFQRWRTDNRVAWDLLRSIQAATPARPIVGIHHPWFSPAFQQARPPKIYFFHGPWAREHISRSALQSSRLRNVMARTRALYLNRLERKALKSAGKIVALSQYSSRLLESLHGDLTPAVQVIPGGVDLDHFKPLPNRSAIRRRYGLSESDFLIVTLRRLDPRMGLSNLVETFASIAGDYPDAKLWLAGKGPQENELNHLIAGRGRGDRIRLLGYVPEEELPLLLNAADLTVMPSLDLEGFGLATLESLSCGAPVLGASTGGTQELLASLEARLLFHYGKPPDLRDKLLEILRGELELPSRRFCRRFASQFGWENARTALNQVLDDLAASLQAG